jgi:hypothetical protein
MRHRHSSAQAGQILRTVYDLMSAIDPRARLQIGLALELRGGRRAHRGACRCAHPGCDRSAARAAGVPRRDHA